jgi:hypothetical protein
MGFWSKLGKGLLKLAPFAAAAIPGIGPIASMAIQGGLGAANAKTSGGGWKDALLGAGVGAAGAKLGGLGSSTKGLSPSSGLLGKLGAIGKQTGTNFASSILPGESGGIGGSGGWLDKVLGVASTVGKNRVAPTTTNRTAPPRTSQSNSRPNVRERISAGRRNAIQNQPFRGGYDVTNRDKSITRMPQIYSGLE